MHVSLGQRDFISAEQVQVLLLDGFSSAVLELW